MRKPGHRCFTGPQQVEKAMRTLEGLIRGVSADGVLADAELTLLREWMADYAAMTDRPPLLQVREALVAAIADGVLDEEEQEDICWLCNQFTTENPFYDYLTSDMQILQGMIAGIAADDIITDSEVAALREWLDHHTELQGAWPYDELYAVLLSVLADGRIDPEERELLLAFFSDFGVTSGHKILANDDTRSGMLLFEVCAACPEIAFTDRTFCFTGKADIASRGTMSTAVQQHGGRVLKKVSKSVDYLVVGSEGNNCWAFACYGRKVEAAIKLRKQGHSIVIVHENDFWDSVQDLGIADG